MRATDRWQEVFETLSRNKLRTFLTALGVFWGVFMLVVMLGFGRGLETGVLGNLGPWAKNALAVWPRGTTIPYAGHGRGRHVRLNTDDVATVKQHVPGVLAVAPRVHMGWGSTTQISRGERSEAFSVSGDVPEYLYFVPMDILLGRFLNQRDVDDRRKVAVIGVNVRDALYEAGEEILGSEIRVDGIPFLVIGVYESEAMGERSDRMNSRILVPMTTLARMNGRGNEISYMTLLLEEQRSSEVVEERVKALLKRQHDIHPEDPGGFGSFNREKEFRRFTNLFDGIATLSWAVGILTLLAGAIGVSNILMISINERTREIGIRKAMGATPRSILAQIVQEALVLTGLSGGLGLVAGAGALAVAAAIFDNMPRGQGPTFFAAPNLDLGIALVATIVLTVSGGLAGIMPARSALSINPVEALAHE